LSQQEILVPVPLIDAERQPRDENLSQQEILVPVPLIDAERQPLDENLSQHEILVPVPLIDAERWPRDESLSQLQMLLIAAGVLKFVFSQHLFHASHDHALHALHQKMSMRECDAKVEAPNVYPILRLLGP
jgi:hypothetical protein